MSEKRGEYLCVSQLTDKQIAQAQSIWARQTSEFAAHCRRALESGMPLSEMRQDVDDEYRRFYGRFVADIHAERK